MDERLNSLKWCFVDLIVDICTAVRAIREKITSPEFDQTDKYTQFYLRMCITSLILSLSKLDEVLKHYGKEINFLPIQIKDNLRLIKKEIERRKIYQFRSKYSAHVINTDTRTPLSLKEGEERYDSIIGSDIALILDFCDWLNPNPTSDSSVVSAIVAARDYLKYNLGADGERP
ncbi:hypothetical protein FEV13_16665 [Stutzerimonas degradans]|nr:hypothetical protein FEV13_16665 [Stutzerimonas degradans]